MNKPSVFYPQHCREHCPCSDTVRCECLQHLRLTSLLTTCGTSLIPPPWLMLQQCSFGIERSPCRLPSDSLRNSSRKHVLPNSLRHALISLTGKETRSGKRTERILNCRLLTSLGGDAGSVMPGERWETSNSGRCLSEPLAETPVLCGATAGVTLPSRAATILNYNVNVWHISIHLLHSIKLRIFRLHVALCLTKRNLEIYGSLSNSGACGCQLYIFGD